VPETIIAPSGGGAGGGGGAPTTAEYLVGALDGTLSAERLVTDTEGVAWDLATAGVAKANVLDRARLLDRAGQFAYNTDNTERSVYSYAVPANLLGSTKALRCWLVFDLLCNSGSPTLILKIKLGATTLYQETTVAFGANATRRTGSLLFTLANQGATNVQSLGGIVFVSNAGAAATTGLGDLGALPILTNPFSGVAGAEDTTGALTLDITTTLSVSNVAVEFRRQHAYLELL